MDPFIGQLLCVGFNYAPVNWFQAQGQILPIQAYTALFALLGVNYGGNGSSNFQLPNLQGSVPLGWGQSSSGSWYEIGQTGGESDVPLTTNNLPPHSHTPMADVLPANQTAPAGNSFAKTASSLGNLYSATTAPLVQMDANALSPFNGGSLPHNNMMPYVALNWIIAYQGIFPQRQ